MQFTISFAALRSAEDQGSAFPQLTFFVHFWSIFRQKAPDIFNKNTLTRPSENEETMNLQKDST